MNNISGFIKKKSLSADFVLYTDHVKKTDMSIIHDMIISSASENKKTGTCIVDIAANEYDWEHGLSYELVYDNYNDTYYLYDGGYNIAFGLERPLKDLECSIELFKQYIHN